MKSTGIVRRIDDLGRVVIPKEIRRNLRIREGDPLEIYIEDGGVLFKKYSLLSLISSMSADFSIALSTNGIRNGIYDRDTILYGTKAFGIRDTPDEWLDIRTPATKCNNLFVTPIISEGETVGFICYKTEDDNKTAHEMIKFAAKVLANIVAEN